MKKSSVKNAPWYSNAVAACIAVILFVLLTRFPSIWAWLRTFVGYFSPVILGCAIAYLVAPLARLYRKMLFGKRPEESAQNGLSNFLAFFTVILFFVLALVMLLPQLVDSVTVFVGSLDSYFAAADSLLEGWGVSSSVIDLHSLMDSSEDLLSGVVTFIGGNLNRILSTSASAGRVLFQWIIAFLISMYLLAEKSRLKSGAARLLRALLPEEKYSSAVVFLRRSDAILHRYFVYNILDALIVGAANAIFMSIAGMPYVGLVSFVVAIANLVPNFGPIVGYVIGAFILLLVRPWYALIFTIFTLILQFVDGYVFKPKFYGSTLGVPSLWILVGVIVGGRMFGIVGILLATPGVAILDFVYHEYLLPRLEARRARSRGESDPEPETPEDTPSD